VKLNKEARGKKMGKTDSDTASIEQKTGMQERKPHYSASSYAININGAD
jgi:hypothetical protein